MTTGQISLFGIRINPVTRTEALDLALRWLRGPRTGRRPMRVVVTPNLNHLRRLETDERLRAAYEDADLVTADGQPLVWASRVMGPPLPERVTGSDLTVDILNAAPGLPRPLRVFIMGGAPEVAERAADRIARRWGNVVAAGRYSPPRGFLGDEAECARMAENVNEAKPDLLLVCLGAPQQEIWLHRHRAGLNAAVGLCAGAAVDFLAGAKPRAPRWMRRNGLEWAHRVLTEPRRLGPRYWRDAKVVPSLLWREWRRRNAEAEVERREH